MITAAVANSFCVFLMRPSGGPPVLSTLRPADERHHGYTGFESAQSQGEFREDEAGCDANTRPYRHGRQGRFPTGGIRTG